MTPTTSTRALPAPAGFTVFADAPVRLRFASQTDTDIETLAEAWWSFVASFTGNGLVVFHHEPTPDRPTFTNLGPVANLGSYYVPPAFEELLHAGGRDWSTVGETQLWTGANTAAARWNGPRGWHFAQLRPLPAQVRDAVDLCLMHDAGDYVAGILKLPATHAAFLSNLARNCDPGLAADVMTAVLDDATGGGRFAALPPRLLNVAGELLPGWQSSLVDLLDVVEDVAGSSRMSAAAQVSWGQLRDLIAAATPATTVALT